MLSKYSRSVKLPKEKDHPPKLYNLASEKNLFAQIVADDSFLHTQTQTQAHTQTQARAHTYIHTHIFN